MNVYIVIHQDDMAEEYEIRGVYQSREDADRERVTRTPSGRPSTAYGAHTKWCCKVEDWEVQ